MLVIDENMFRLAKMQETLLKVSATNREENLKKYVETVSEIDDKAFGDILEEIKHISEHNQSLEEELQFLGEIKKTYDQLLELQLNFKGNCKKYGNVKLQLSDLSRLDIEYIENRINAIKGYLTNLKNIESSKEKLQKLNEELLVEEKKKRTLDSRLAELEQNLRENFGTIEGRCIVDGRLERTSISSEYEKINLDFERLLTDEDYLRSTLTRVESEKNEVSEKVKVAEVCYKSMPNADSKQILDEINIEFLKVKYKLSMLEIIDLLLKNSDSYSSFVSKRRTMLDLIKYRLVCMESLGMKISIDPFSRTKVKEQLDSVQMLSDNSNVINNIMKEIGHLNTWIEEMLSQNNSYLITINNTKQLIEDRVSFNDIDISPVVSFEELLVKQTVEDNQVIKVRTASSKFNMNIIGQKTASVIKRVNEMINTELVKVKDRSSEIVPELVIVPMTPTETMDEIVSEVPTVDEEISLDEELPMEDSVIFSEDTDEVIEEEESKNQENDLFKFVTPFDEPVFFMDKLEDTSDLEKSDSVEQPLVTGENVEETAIEETPVTFGDMSDEMPEVFWTTQDERPEISELEEVSSEISFDDQINALLSSEINDTSKSRKRVA